MIIGRDINPERHIYHIGGKILKLISIREDVDFFDTFHRLNTEHKISMNLYILSLDWLFVLGIIAQKDGKIIKCS